MNNQTNIGSANIISGVPERVGAPVDAFKEVGAVLTQRYWQNKQQMDGITIALKNAPIINKDLDTPELAKKSKYVDDSFKQVIDSDNFHNATATVMEVGKTLATDTFLKSLNSNVAKIQAWEKDFDERLKQPGNENLRMWKDQFRALTYKGYKGSVDENGNAVSINIQDPKTNMNLEDEMKRIEDLVTKIPAQITESFGNLTHISEDQINLIKDETTRNILRSMPTSETKTTREVRSKEKIREAVINYLATDADFNTKVSEIAFMTHFKNTGKTSADVKSLKKILKANDTYALRVVASISPTFKDMEQAIINKYEDNMKSDNIAIRNKAIQAYNKEMKALQSNDVIIDEGIEMLDKQSQVDIDSLYFGLAEGALKDEVVNSGAKFEINNTRLDKDRFNTDAFLNAYLKEKDEEESYSSVSDVKSLNIPLENSILNPKSKIGAELIDVENAYNQMMKDIADKKPINAKYKNDITTKYAHLQSIKESTNKNLYNSYLILQDEDKKDVEGSATNAFSNSPLQSRYIQSVRRFGYQAGMKTARKDIQNMQQMLGKINIEDVFNLSTKQIISKYSTEKKMSISDINYISKAIEDTRLFYSKRIVDKAEEKGTITVPISYTTTIGSPSLQEQGLTNDIVSSLKSGALIDVFTNTLIQDKDGFAEYDFSTAKIRTIQHNGALLGKYAYEITAKQRIKDANGNYKKDGVVDKTFTVYYEGGNALSTEFQVQKANDAVSGLYNPVSQNSSKNRIIDQVKTIGGNTFVSTSPDDSNPIPIWDKINEYKLQPGAYKDNLYLPSMNTRLNISKTSDPNASPVMIVTDLEGKPKPGFAPKGYYLQSIENLVNIVALPYAKGLHPTAVNVIMNDNLIEVK